MRYLHLGSSVSQPLLHSLHRLQAGRLWMRLSRSKSAGGLGAAVDIARHGAPPARHQVAEVGKWQGNNKTKLEAAQNRGVWRRRYVVIIKEKRPK